MIFQNNNRLVCEETAFVVEGLFDLWKGKPVVEYEDVTEVTIAVSPLSATETFGPHILAAIASTHGDLWSWVRQASILDRYCPSRRSSNGKYLCAASKCLMPPSDI